MGFEPSNRELEVRREATLRPHALSEFTRVSPEE